MPKKYKTLLAQWQQYLEPDEKTPADWERLPKPEAKGFLVPIMIGYKAITPVYDNSMTIRNIGICASKIQHMR